MNSHRHPHVSQQDRDALEDLGLVDHDAHDRSDVVAIHVEVVMAS